MPRRDVCRTSLTPMVRVLWLVVGSPSNVCPVRRSFAESDHGLVHRGEEMISTQLLQERTVFQVVVHQFGCPGDCDHGATRSSPGEGSKRLEPRVVDVRDPAASRITALTGSGSPRRAGRSVRASSQRCRTTAARRRVDENARTCSVGCPTSSGPVVGARLAAEDRILGPAIAWSGRQREDQGSQHPCSMPTSATTNRVIVASANSRRRSARWPAARRHETAWPQ